MVPWSTRYKIGSTKNKPPQVPEDDLKLVRLARIAQIFYELYIKLTAAKGMRLMIIIINLKCLYVVYFISCLLHCI